MKLLLIQIAPEKLQDEHVTKAIIGNKNNRTIVFLKFKMTYSLVSYSLRAKISWSLTKKENSLLEKSQNMINVVQV